jgi:hypothetical protein
MALALTPVAVAIGLSALASAKSDGAAGRIWPGLAAVTGLLLILVQPNLGNLRSDVALILAPTLTGLGAALYDSRAKSPTGAIPTTLLGATALFAIAAVASHVTTGHQPTLSLLAIAYEGILSILSILVLSRLGATRWSSQFTWLPLLILLEGIVMIRPPVTARWLTGLALLAVASIYLLLPRDDEAAVTPPTLG